MRRFLLWIAMEFLLLLSLLWISVLLGGCSAKYFTYRVPHKEPVPLDCQDVKNIHIPPGCFMKNIPDGIEVACPGHRNMTYKCEAQ